MKKLTEKIGAWIKSVFEKAFQRVKYHSRIAVDITQGLKKVVVDNPAVLDLVTAIIPGTWDDGLVKIARKIIPQVAHETLIAHNIIQASEDPTGALEKLVEYLQSLPYEGQRDFYITIAAKFALAISDGKVTLGELVAITQAIYFEVYVKPRMEAA